MTSNQVRAQILTLVGSIIAGTSTEDEIKRVVDLAREHNLLPLLNAGFHDAGKILHGVVL